MSSESSIQNTLLENLDIASSISPDHNPINLSSKSDEQKSDLTLTKPLKIKKNVSSYPPCKYGIGCTKQICKFYHPATRVKYCGKCGREAFLADNYCTICGHRLLSPNKETRQIDKKTIPCKFGETCKHQPNCSYKHDTNVDDELIR